MSKKLHSGLKRTLAWMLVVALMVQGCMVVYADDFTSEPDAAVVSDEISDEDDNVENDLEVAEDENASVDVENPDESDADTDAEVTVEEEKADESGMDAFSDGSNVATFSDGAAAVGDTELKRESDTIEIADGQKYSYTRLYDANDYIRWAVGQYPANNSTITMNVNDSTQAFWQFDLARNDKKNYADTSITWYNANSSSTYVKKPISWESSNPSVVEVKTGTGYPYSYVTLKALKASSEPVKITATWEDTRYSTGTITNVFYVDVNPERTAVNIGQEFTLEGSISSPSAKYYKLSGGEKEWPMEKFWLGQFNDTPRTPEVDLVKVEGNGFQTATMKYKLWREDGMITHRFIIDFEAMVGREPGSTVTSSSGGTFRKEITESLYQPVNAPEDSISVNYVSDDTTGFMKDGNVVFKKSGGTNGGTALHVYLVGVKDGKKIDCSKISWESSDPTIVTTSPSTDTNKVLLKAYKVGGVVMTGTYQEKDENNKPVGDSLTISFRVFVRGFYVDEPVGSDGSTKTVELSLDEEDNAKTKAIKYKLIDGSGETGEAASAEGITWSIDKPTIATVDSDGVVTAKSAGEATVTAKYDDLGITETVKIIVKGSGSLALDKAEAKITKGGTATVKATATSNGSTVRNPEIIWESEDDKIATVDGGKITGVAYGTTTVKASWTAGNGKTYTNSIPVSVVYDGLYLSDAQNEVTMAQGSTQEILWQIQNMGEYSKGSTGAGYNSSSDVTWASANEAVATVDSAGVVTAKNLPEGETTASTTIIVSYKGKKAKEIKVNVTDNQTLATGTTVEVAGTKGEQVTSKTDGSDISNEWKAGSYKDGHGSLNAQFNSNRDNFDIVDGTGSTAKVTGKTPSEGYAYLSHKYYLPLETGQNCVVWEGIAVKVTGEAGLYLDKSSVSMKMGESGTATIQGTYITEKGEEWKSWADEKNPNFSTIHMIDGDTNVVTAEPDPKNGSILKLTAVAPGTTTITVQFDTSTRTAACDVTVTSDARLILQPSDLTVKKGGTETITAKAWDGSAYVDNPEITWKSYDESIAIVENGIVTGVDRGNVTIGATWGNVIANDVQVTVIPTRNVIVSTEWNDSDDQDGIRPEKATIQLTANGEKYGDPIELNAQNKWTYEWQLLEAEDAKGNNIVYRVTAENPEEYTAKVTGSADDGFVITYSHEIEKTDLTASVVWDDADNKDGIRPSSVSFQLKADDTVVGDPITVNANSKWSKTWENLAANKAGTAINYTVEVSGINTGEDQYTVTTSGDAASGFVFTASHVPAEVEITASAAWDDADNQDGIRPESVEAELYADRAATGDKVTLNAENNWTASFGEKELKKDGKSVAYTVKATEAEGYTVDVSGNGVNGFSLKYAHTPETISVSVSTVWNDKENQDGNRPNAYSVQLYADGVKYGDKLTLDAANEFSKTWTGLQKYRTGKVREEIVYTAEVTGLPETYETSVSGNASEGFVVTNTYVPTTVEIPVSVTWNDADNQDGIRPETVEAELYADGEATGNKVTLNAENGWAAKFAAVDVKKDGTRIKYEVKSTETEDYEISVSGDILDENGLTVAYKHVPATVNVSVKAAWNDANNQDGIRPTDTLLQLYADGEARGDKAVLESEKDWTRIWSDLPKYKEGKEIAYSVIAYAVSGYTVKVSGSATEGFKAEYTHSVQKMTVTVKNTWNDLDNVVDSRPSKLVVEIYANGKATGRRVTLTDANKWIASVANLNRNASGKAVSYTGKVVGAPAGYSISVSADRNGNVKVTSKYTKYTKKLKVKLSKTSYVYNGKTAKPKVTVYNGNKKVSSKYYTLTYKNNKKTGYATVIVKGKSKFAKYAGKATFTIKPKTMRKPTVKKGAKRTLNVSWVRDTQATKYVVQYSQSSKFKGASTKSVTINSNKTGKITLKGLTSGKNYYVRIRSCKVVNGKTIWAASWSQATKIKVK